MLQAYLHYPLRARLLSRHRPATAAAAPSLHPTASVSTHRAIPRSSGSPASPSGVSAHRIGCRRQKSVNQVTAGDWLGFGAAVALKLRPVVWKPGPAAYRSPEPTHHSPYPFLRAGRAELPRAAALVSALSATAAPARTDECKPLLQKAIGNNPS
jgi:hypothetical protein